MQNTDIGSLFQNWFICGFSLVVAFAMVQIIAVYLLAKERQSFWLKSLYMAFDSVLVLLTAGWLYFGAYWRFREFGVLCSEEYLAEQGEGMLMFYKFGAVLGVLSMLGGCLGCCAGFWSYYSSLPLRRYH